MKETIKGQKKGQNFKVTLISRGSDLEEFETRSIRKVRGAFQRFFNWNCAILKIEAIE